MSDLKFSGDGKTKPSTQARKYVYRVIGAMLDHQLSDNTENREGWIFGGIDNEFDRRRLTAAIKRIQLEMYKKGRE